MGMPHDGRKSDRAAVIPPCVVRRFDLVTASMQTPPSAPDAGADSSARTAGGAPGYLAIALQVMTDTGYGIWALQGMALAFGIFREGRGESLVPLAAGALLVIAGLIVASVRVPGLPAWHGWHPGQNAWPTRQALIALASFLPMLAVAGLTRGDNDFWATRLAGAALMLTSLASLIHNVPRGTFPVSLGSAAVLPAGRVMAALYGGGLWLWLFVAADGHLAVGPAQPQHQPWLLVLLIMALLLGLIEGMRWHALRASDTAETAPARGSVIPARFAAALLGYAVPCVALLLADRWQASGALALGAALGAMVGRVLEQRLYACAHCAAGSAFG